MGTFYPISGMPINKGLQELFPNGSVDVLAIRSCPQMLRICSFFLQFACFPLFIKLLGNGNILPNIFHTDKQRVTTDVSKWFSRCPRYLLVPSNASHLQFLFAICLFPFIYKASREWELFTQSLEYR